MFVVMAVGASEAEVIGVKSRILSEGLTPYEHAGAERLVIAVVGEIGSRRNDLIGRFGALPGVERVTPISKPYKLTSREFHPEDTVVRVLDAVVGDGSLTVMAGPCSVESRDQLMETADAVAEAGATILRGGAFKPRTSPYSFQGLGVEALRYLAEARERTGLPVITEVMEANQLDIVAEYADIVQIGTRNMQNFSLLNACGRTQRPVMLKRGYGATIEEWLMAAEYIVSSGNPNVILCERGIRTFETATRNTMDVSAVPVLHELTHLPVVADPSHATGKRSLVPPLAMASVAAGRRRDHGRGASAARGGALGRAAAADARDVPGDDGQAHAAPRARRRSGGGGARVSTVLDPEAPRTLAIVRPAARLRGELRLPGDKSISHRALLFAALAAGESRIAGAGDGGDVRSTAGIVRALGVEVSARARSGGSGRLPGRLAGGRRADRARGHPRLRQLRDVAAAGRRGARGAADVRRSSTATRHCDAVRSPVSSAHCARWERCSTLDERTPCPHSPSSDTPRFGPWTTRHRFRAHRSNPRSCSRRCVPRAGPPSGKRWERGITRSGCFVLAASTSGARTRAGAALRGAWKEDGRCVRSTSVCPATSPRLPSGWSARPSIPTRSCGFATSGLNPSRRAVIDLLRAMGASISGDEGGRRRRRRRADGRPDGPIVATFAGSSSGRARSRPRSTRSRSSASRRRRPSASPASAGPASCGTRNWTGSRGSSPGSARSAPTSRWTATTSRSRGPTPLRGAHDRQPRRPPARDDVRDRGAGRGRRDASWPGPAAPPISYPGFFADLERVRA